MRSCIGVKLRVSVSGASWGSIEDSGELDRALQYNECSVWCLVDCLVDYVTTTTTATMDMSDCIV